MAALPYIIGIDAGLAAWLCAASYVRWDRFSCTPWQCDVVSCTGCVKTAHMHAWTHGVAMGSMMLQRHVQLHQTISVAICDPNATPILSKSVRIMVTVAPFNLLVM
jgi:hypothetical protein